MKNFFTVRKNFTSTSLLLFVLYYISKFNGYFYGLMDLIALFDSLLVYSD